MVKWTLWVEKINDDDIIDIEIDSQSTFLEFRKKAAAALNVKWEDLVLGVKKEYDKQYNSKTLEEIHQMDWMDFHDGCSLYSIISILGGTFRY